MGLSKILRGVKEKAASYPGQKYNDYQAERAHQREEKLEQRNQFEKGRREGEYQKGLIQGEGRGRVTEYTEYNSKGKPIKTAKYGKIQEPQQQRSGGARPGFRSTMKHSDDIFGWSSGGGVAGLGLGFGDEPRKQVAPPMRKTVFNPRTGKVETYEPIQQPHQRPQETGDFIMGTGSERIDNSNFILGPTGLSNKKNKTEKHPYDIF
jgi:hypothetical protein